MQISLIFNSLYQLFSFHELLQAMDTPTVSPYPGFDRSGQYLTPRKAPRVKPEAEEYASRNLGTTNIFSSEHYEPIVTPSPSPRCPSYEARDNYQRSRGQVAGLLGGSGPAVPLESAPAPRSVSCSYFPQKETMDKLSLRQKVSILHYFGIWKNILFHGDLFG